MNTSRKPIPQIDMERLNKVQRVRAYLRDVGILERVEAESGEVRDWNDDVLEAAYREVKAFEPRDEFLIAPRVDRYMSDVVKLFH